MNAVMIPELSIESFESGDIDPDRFDHESHIYLGWLYLKRYDPAAAIARFEAALKRLLKKLGADAKYHATLTWFFMLLIAERSAVDESWPAFRQRNADMFTGSRNILARYYSAEMLGSNRARHRFVLPDNLA